VEIIFITIPITILFIATGVALFFWASKGGQFDDLDSPAHRILFDDDNTPSDQTPKETPTSKDQKDTSATDKLP